MGCQPRATAPPCLGVSPWGVTQAGTDHYPLKVGKTKSLPQSHPTKGGSGPDQRIAKTKGRYSLTHKWVSTIQKQILSDSYHLSTNLESQGSPCGDQSMTDGQICNMVWEPQWACPLSVPKERNLQKSYDEQGWGIPEWGLHTPKGCGYPTLFGRSCQGALRQHRSKPTSTTMPAVPIFRRCSACVHKILQPLLLHFLLGIPYPLKLDSRTPNPTNNR